MINNNPDNLKQYWLKHRIQLKISVILVILFSPILLPVMLVDIARRSGEIQDFYKDLFKFLKS